MTIKTEIEYFQFSFIMTIFILDEKEKICTPRKRIFILYLKEKESVCVFDFYS